MCEPQISWINIYSVHCKLYVMCIVKIWSYHCGLLVQLILCMWPISAWEYERQGTASTSSQHTEDELEDTIQPAVLAFSEQELQFLIVFLAGVNHGCKLEVMSITCCNMTVYCTVQVLCVDSKSRLCCKLVVLYVHMRRGDNRRQSQGCTKGEGCQAAAPTPTSKFKWLDFLDII